MHLCGASLPYLRRPSAARVADRAGCAFPLADARRVTEAEVQFKKVHGMEALEQRLRSLLDYLDPLRGFRRVASRRGARGVESHRG